jgi:hypothetical protein
MATTREAMAIYALGVGIGIAVGWCFRWAYEEWRNGQ